MNLKIETINKLGEIFNVTPSFIMGWDEFDEVLDTDRIKKEIRLAELLTELYAIEERDLIFKACELNEEGKKKLFSYINDLVQLDQYMK